MVQSLAQDVIFLVNQVIMIGIINTIVSKVVNSQGREIEDDPNESVDRFSVMGDSRVSVNIENTEIPETP